jgi:predicted type IV restriction endonuclease
MSSWFDEKRVLSEVQRLAALIEKDKGSQPNEHTTEVKYIVPLLEKLGWSVADDSLCLQYAVKSSRVDMALMAHGKPVAFVEAKRLRQDLSLKDTEAAQALQYGYESGTNWCVLTNGERYEVYDAFAKVEHAKKLVVSFSVSEVAQHPQREVPKLRLLSYEAITGGELRCFAQHRFACERVREVLEEPSPAVVGVLVRELEAFGLKEDDVRLALAEVLGTESAGDGAGWGPQSYIPPIIWSERRVTVHRKRCFRGDVKAENVTRGDLEKAAQVTAELGAEGGEFDITAVTDAAGFSRRGRAGNCLGVMWAAGLLAHTRGQIHSFYRLDRNMTAEEIIAAVRAKAESAKP